MIAIVKPSLYEVVRQAGADFHVDAGWLLPADFGDAAREYRAARDGAALFYAPHRGKIQATGPDAAGFLHNLSSNDIRALAPGSGCEAFFLNVKARVLGLALIYRSAAAEFWLDLDPLTDEAVLKHLDRHLISEQVELADRTREQAQFHLAGPQARPLLDRVIADLPPLAALQVVSRPLGPVETGQVRRSDLLGLPGYDLLCDTDRAEAVWRALTDAGATPAGLTTFDVLRIEAGRPRYERDVDESHLAPEVDRPAAISYQKGCYLGQEPVVRIRDLGQVNRRLRGVRVGGAVAQGAKLYRGAEAVGEVTSAATSPSLGPIALAYLRRGSDAPGTELEVDATGGRLPAMVCSLPFAGP
jgi:tRNA-modifying protein YgfZ